MAENRPVGHTKDAGWEIGVSRTVDMPVRELWNRVVSPEGLAVWLGDLGAAGLPTRPGAPYETADGAVGEVRGYRPLDRVRVTYRAPGADRESTLQIAMGTGASGRTRITFHQERMADAAERERQRAHWTSVADLLLGAS